MTDLVMVGAIAAGTLALRASLVAFLGEVTIPTRLEQALRLVAPAILGGIVAQGLVVDGRGFRPLGTWHVAAVLAALVAWKTRSIGLTLGVGMSAVWILEALV
jgi:branched-subunit amino acid transport protein